jgi:hypothetical protein
MGLAEIQQRRAARAAIGRLADVKAAELEKAKLAKSAFIQAGERAAGFSRGTKKITAAQRRELASIVCEWVECARPASMADDLSAAVEYVDHEDSLDGQQCAAEVIRAALAGKPDEVADAIKVACDDDGTATPLCRGFKAVTEWIEAAESGIRLSRTVAVETRVPSAAPPDVPSSTVIDSANDGTMNVGGRPDKFPGLSEVLANNPGDGSDEHYRKVQGLYRKKRPKWARENRGKPTIQQIRDKVNNRRRKQSGKKAKPGG